MFTKNNNNTYLFPHDHHHHHHPRSSVVDLNGVELFLHHHHHHHHPDIFSAHHYNNNNNNNNSNIPSANLADNHHHHHHHQAGATNLLLNQDAASSQKKAQTSKKDRHSKIFTSQGPRDRRVRLSIGIARKFFDLQEMLGFDKPSKTLDWLLTKSKAAIKDLIHSKDKSKTSSNESDELVIPSQQLLEYGELEAVSSKGKSGKNITKGAGAGAGAGASSSTSLAKESRAKARARARERTREKMCIKQMNKNGGGENGPCLDSPNPFNAININHQLGLFGQSSNNREAALFQDHDLIQESVSVKRKTKSNVVPSFFGFQQNVFVSRDSGSNYGGVVPFVANNNNENNWDVCSFTSQSNMCAAILEQQKFMNSSSNM